MISARRLLLHWMPGGYIRVWWRAACRSGDRSNRVEVAVHISGNRIDNLVGAAVRSGDMSDKGEGAEYTSGVSDNIS